MYMYMYTCIYTFLPIVPHKDGQWIECASGCGAGSRASRYTYVHRLCYIPYICMPVDRYTYIVHTNIDFFASRYTHVYRVCHIPYICMHVGIHTYIVQIYIDFYASRYTYIYTVCHVPYLTVAVKFHCHSEKICDSQIITCSSNQHSAKDGARNSTYNHAVQHKK